MDPIEGTFFKVNVDRPDFRIYISNVRIHFRNVQQSALPFTTMSRLLADPAVLVNP